MIYVLKKDDLYVSDAIGTLRVDLRNGRAKRIPNTKVQFRMTKDINLARLVEDPNMDAVKKYGLTAHLVKSYKPLIAVIVNIL